MTWPLPFPPRAEVRGAANGDGDGGTSNLRRAIALTMAALAWERLWRALWLPVALVGLYVALAWLEVPTALPWWLHLPFNLAAMAGVALAARHGFRSFAWPGPDDARRRLEVDAALTHRPLAFLRDRPVGNDPVAAALWQTARERALARISGLSAAPPRPDVAARDPWALRIAVALLLVVSGTVAHDDWGPRLERAVLPSVSVGTSGPAASIDVWVTPPEYTGQPPVFLNRRPAQVAKGDAERGATARTAGNEGEGPPVALPIGSILSVRVSGGWGTPKLSANGGVTPLEPAPGGGFQLTAPLTAGDTIALRQGGRELGAWPIRIVPDQAPGIAFRQPLGVTERFSTRIDYTAGDDYGVVGATATFRLTADLPSTVDRAPIVLALSIPGLSPREVSATTFEDLTAHPWAGFPVAVRLEAVDAAQQTGSSPEQTFVLPERTFNHPVARAIIDERKKLILMGELSRESAARALAEISARPGAFGDDLSAFLALRSAIGRLVRDKAPTAMREILSQLWEVALAIEDGGLSAAERDLRAAEQRLMDALDRNADDKEIDRLMQDLRQAMQDFLSALEERMQAEMERDGSAPETPLPDDAQTLDRSDLERMLDEMRDLAQTGSRDAAREMLSQLREMLENLRTGQPGENRQAQENARRMGESMRQLQELTRQQQELMDRTFRRSQEEGGQDPSGQGAEERMGQPGRTGPNRQGAPPRNGPGQSPDGRSGPGGEAGEMAAQQDALRRQLGDLMRRFGESGGEIPRPLGNADRSMRDAGQALRQGAPGAAVPPQAQALDSLRQGLEQMSQQMQQMQQQAGRPGLQPGQRPQAGRQPGRDPLGRQPPASGVATGDSVKIPDQSDVQRAREILDELRRRSGDRDRSRLERDYIERLLERF